MYLPDLHPPAIVTAVENPAPGIASTPTISTDIHALQCWRDLELDLAAIRAYGKNWDGRGSDSPSPSAMDAAGLFLAICQKYFYENPPARIALSPSGLLTVDWLDGKALVRAEILNMESNEIEWMRALPGQSAEFFTTALIDQTGSRTEQVQTWQPAQVAEDELALACGQ